MIAEVDAHGLKTGLFKWNTWRPRLTPSILFYTGTADQLDPGAKLILSAYEVFESVPDDQTLKRIQVLLTWPSRPRPELLSKLSGLKMIQTLSAGVDALNFELIPKGVKVFSNAGAYTDTAAEHVWGLALGMAKGLHAGRLRLTPRHLRSGIILVVGCGAIGSEVARLARSSLGMSTIGVSRSFKKPELFDERYPISELGEVIGRADLVINALPLTRATKGTFNYSILSRSKQDVVIANIGRGETVDEESLTRFLKERPGSRYATDVFWKRDGREVFDTKLWELPNFGGTVHTASAQDPAALAHAQEEAAKNVRLFLETGAALNQVDVEEYLEQGT
jgi:D-3-phosphoglycerate dehydrogenase